MGKQAYVFFKYLSFFKIVWTKLELLQGGLRLGGLDVLNLKQKGHVQKWECVVLKIQASGIVSSRENLAVVPHLCLDSQCR